MTHDRHAEPLPSCVWRCQRCRNLNVICDDDGDPVTFDEVPDFDSCQQCGTEVEFRDCDAEDMD